MPVFLFWNVGRRRLSEYVASACLLHKVDIAILAECEEDSFALVNELNAYNPQHAYWEYKQGISSLKFITRLPPSSIRAIADDGRSSIRLIQPASGPDFLIAATHLRSKLYADDMDQHASAMELSRLISEAERQIGHKRTMVIGDLNMDPFDNGMLASNGLHAIMDKSIARRVSRRVQGRDYDFL